MLLLDSQTAVALQAANQPAPRTWKDFAVLINGAWRRSAEAFIQAGRYLVEAKEELDRDEFAALVKLRLDFDASVARRLMCIAGDRTICAHAHKLPPCWTSIYELTKLESDVLEAAIADGRINPKMQRKDAVALRKPPESRKIAPSPPLAEPAPSFAAAWDATSEAEIRTKLDSVGCAGLCKIMSDELKAEFGDRILGQSIRTSSASNSFTIKATDRLHTVLRCAEQDKPSEQDVQTIIATLRAIARDAERRGLSRSDVVIAEGTNKHRKKR